MNPLSFWQDSEVRFDVPLSCLQLTAGERLLEKFESVEDVKGNSGDPGTLLLTNLRIIWHSNASPKLNLSIGHDTVNLISTQIVNAKAKGTAETLYVLTKSPKGKFEFVFVGVDGEIDRMTDTVASVSRAYAESKLFRELRLRSHIIQGKQVKVLPGEQVCDRKEGVWNLASNQGNLGCFVLTNVRLVWFATMNELFNISLPYIQVSNISVKDSKFGLVLVIETTEKSGGYLLGFRIDPVSQLKAVYQEIRALFEAQLRNPVLGINWNPSTAHEPAPVASISTDADKTEDSGNESVDAWATYWAHDQSSVNSAPPALWEVTGLAVEQLPVGITMDSLWKVPI